LVPSPPEVDGVHRLADSVEDPVQALWRMENEARLALRFREGQQEISE
jgi:hypothetical protein